MTPDLRIPTREEFNREYAGELTEDSWGRLDNSAEYYVTRKEADLWSHKTHFLKDRMFEYREYKNEALLNWREV